MSIFGLIVVLLVAAIAYFHYAQGLFSATLSAMFAVLAAVLAVSYHETLEELVSRGGLADQARAITLVVLFAGIYILLRTAFDKFVPGNIRLPVLVDRIGAGAMGVVAGIFAMGVVALAAQTLPFGGSIAGYARYEIQEPQTKTVPNERGYRVDTVMGDTLPEMRSSRFTEEERQGLIVPVDDMVVGLVGKLSGPNGSLAGSQPLARIHPDYLQELFGQRIGIQLGAKHQAINSDTAEQVKVAGVYVLDHPVPAVDAERVELRDPARASEVKSPFAARGEDVAVVVRVVFTKSASDKDNLARFSPGSVRLVMNDTNYFPEGTLEGGVLYANRMDDPLFVNVGDKDRAADVVFKVKRGDLEGGEAGSYVMPRNAFVEVKRGARVELAGKPLQPGAKLAETSKVEVQVLRKPAVAQKGGAAATQAVR